MTMPDGPNAQQYLAARLRRALAEDPRTSELGVRVIVRGEQVLISGDVASEQRREELATVLAEVAPELHVYNDVRVVAAGEPTRTEELT
jgi:hypothetical protein